MEKTSKIFVAGHKGLAGSAICRALEKNGYSNLLQRDRGQLDLEDQRSVREFFKSEKPEYVFLAAARVGGIMANNTYRAEFIYNNLIIQTNVIDAAWRAGTQRLMFLGSSCIYPRHCPQPMKEEHLLTGPLEPTNEPYAVAKIAGIKMCEAYNAQYGASFVSVMPTNLYGPNDNFDIHNAHVLPALLRRVHEAKKAKAPEIVVWGTGTPTREFLHADDMASACLFVMQKGITEMVNIGTGVDVTIAELARLICSVVGYEGEVKFDPSKPDGTPRKRLDVSRLGEYGWNAGISLEEGLESAYRWFLASKYV
ncbi:MAG: GDP-L-fucose synthase [Nitrospinae bacterium]|nr:GDP-L-fucose synthase [Nitrospinota bacterium]